MSGLDHPRGNVDAVGRDQGQGPPILVAADLVQLDRPPPQQPGQVLPGPFRCLGLSHASGAAPDLRVAGRDVAPQMVDAALARPYRGERRQGWC